jgi:hypothetical protein
MNRSGERAGDFAAGTVADEIQPSRFTEIGRPISNSLLRQVQTPIATRNGVENTYEFDMPIPRPV